MVNDNHFETKEFKSEFYEHSTLHKKRKNISYYNYENISWVLTS